MANICIIGINGVGRAHMVSALNIGHRVPLVIDTATAINQKPWSFNYDNRTLRVVNKWGDLTDVFHGYALPPRFVPLDISEKGSERALERLIREHEINLVILATPTRLHVVHAYHVMLAADYPIRMLIEKAFLPLDSSGDEWDLATKMVAQSPRMFLGYEWMHHPKLFDAIGSSLPTKITFIHGGPHSCPDPIEDLGVHTLSIAHAACRIEDRPFKLEFLSAHTGISVPGIVVPVEHSTSRWRYWDGTEVEMVVGYSPPGTDELVEIKTAAGDTVRLDWRDLFAVQMQRVLNCELQGDARAAHGFVDSLAVEQHARSWYECIQEQNAMPPPFSSA